MAKKDKFESPEYEKVKSVEQIDKNILECQRIISRKYRLRVQAESGRRDMVASYNEQIKHLKEELDHELGVLSAWEDRKKIVSLQGATEDEADQEVETPVPEPIPASAPVMAAPAPVMPQPVVSSIPLPPAPPPPMVLPPTSQVPIPGGSMIPFPRKASAAS